MERKQQNASLDKARHSRVPTGIEVEVERFVRYAAERQARPASPRLIGAVAR